MVDSTRKEAKIRISTSAVYGNQTQTEYETLDTSSVPVSKIIDWPALGFEVDVEEFKYLDTKETKSSATFYNGQSTTIRCGVDYDDLGQQELDAAFEDQLGRALIFEKNDKLNSAGTNTIQYTYVKVTGRTEPEGMKDEVEYTVIPQQLPIIDPATAG